MTETPLQQCQRHVLEGAARITRQEALIVELERDGHQRMLPDAYTFLRVLCDIQRFGEEHLARELAKAGKPP